MNNNDIHFQQAVLAEVTRIRRQMEEQANQTFHATLKAAILDFANHCNTQYHEHIHDCFNRKSGELEAVHASDIAKEIAEEILELCIAVEYREAPPEDPGPRIIH